MNIGIRYAARSDVGMLREGNEDSAYAGAHLIAVADGMGGHVGGEIASAAAIGELRKLDTDLPAGELLAALEHTVQSANERLHSIVESDPALQGMGTTLTAMLWSGSQVALVHIGDSRAYLLRDGSLFQITRDHTLVQSLVDEGRISPDEAASHPQRSLLLRALDGRGEVDPDLSLREAKIGDRYLLCSDGLSTVVTAETIFQVLTDFADPEQAIRQLIDLANRGGGPDNITCVVADVVDLGAQPGTPKRSMVAGAAANATQTEPQNGPGGPGSPTDTPAGRARQIHDANTMPQPPVVVDEMPPPAPAPAPMAEPAAPPESRRQATAVRPRRRWTWLIVMVGVLVLILAAGGLFAVKSIRDGYYIGADGKQVALFRGSPGFPMSRKAGSQPNPPLLLEDLPESQQAKVTKKYAIDRADDWKRLRDMCVFKLQQGAGGQIALVRTNANGCKAATISAGGFTLDEMPTDKRNFVTGSVTFKNRESATKQLTDLKSLVDTCKAKQDTPNCPQQGGRGPK